MGDGTKLEDFVSLWCGIGESSPIERARHLKAQNDELKRLLEMINKEVQLSPDLSEQINLTLKHLN